MAETNCSTPGSIATTEPSRPISFRRAIWGVAIGIASVLFFGSAGLSFTRTRQLQRDLAYITPDSFTVGVRLRETLYRMDDALLRFQLTEDVSIQDQFTREARRFTELAREAGSGALASETATNVAEIESRFETYLADTRDLLLRGVRGVRRDTPLAIAHLIRDKSQVLRGSVERLVQAQNGAANAFLWQRQVNLQSLDQSNRLVLASGMVLALTALGLWAGLGGLRWERGIPSHEAQLRQERLAALGVLAAGVAHEIRNPLTALKFRLFSLKKSLPPGFAEDEDLVILSREVNRLERIVKDFLEFARPAEPKRVNLNAGQILRDVHELWRADLEKRGIHTRLDVDANACIWADPQQLQQVLINLLQNAAESTPAGGNITLAVRPGAARLLKRAQATVMYEVSDSGPGISSGVQTRIFEPFFSTKEGGSGLGLSIAARIVEMHEGQIQVASQPGRGTTFTIVLPKAQSHASQDSSS